MLEIDGKYGSLYIDGKNINIEKTKIEDLENYLEKITQKESQLIQIQNQYISKIIS